MPPKPKADFPEHCIGIKAIVYLTMASATFLEAVFRWGAMVIAALSDKRV
jgi:hypothetical protein